MLFAGILHFLSSSSRRKTKRAMRISLLSLFKSYLQLHLVKQRRHSPCCCAFLTIKSKAEHPRTAQFPICSNKRKEQLPSSSSRLAPPPVLTWLTLSSVFHLAQQVAVSPPPVAQENAMRQKKLRFSSA